MSKLVITLTILIALVMTTGHVTAAEADAQPAKQMESINLDAEAPDIEAEDFDDDDDDDDGITFDFVINAIPAALLIDMSGNNFGLTDDETSVRSTASSVYMMPNIQAGVGAEVADRIYLDGMLGLGLLVNESLRSFFVQAAIAASYEASASLSIGPRIGLIQFLGTEWLDDAEFDEVDFEDSTGLMIGLQIAMGDRVRYLVNIDYIMMDFDLDNVPEGVTPDDETFELEGLAVQFGVRGEF